MHLPLIGRRRPARVRTGPGPDATAPTTTALEALVESIGDRQSAALVSLGAATGGASLCSLSRGGVAVPTVKYHEGAVSALAEARRALRTVADGPGAPVQVHAVLLDLQARWRSEVGTSGRTGRDWTGYLNGGLDALAELVDDDGKGSADGRDRD